MTHMKKSKKSSPASLHHKLQAASNPLTRMKKSKTITDFYKSKKITDFYKSNKEDRLSSLPESLIVSILSLLPIHTAAATSLLSRHWRYLWTQTTSFSNYLRTGNYNHYTYDEDSLGKFVPIINHIFEQLTSPTLHTFDILLPNFYKNWKKQLQLCDESPLGTWVRRACDANVANIYVDSDSRPSWLDEPTTVMLLPTCVFQCRSLVSLRIGQKFRIKLPENRVINLPNLKKLALKVVDWDCETMSTLFKSCPMLESLDLDTVGVKERFLVDVSCHSLRSLTLRGEHNSSGWNYVLDTPSLVFVSASFLRCHRLVAANNDFAYLFKGLVYGIRSINFLEVNSYMLYQLSYCDCKFANLSKLDVSLDNIDACGNLIRYLHCVPSLEILVIQQNFDKKEGLDWVLPNYCTVLTCLSSKLKKVVVTYPHEKREDLTLLEYILRNGNVLEKVSIKVWSLDHGQIGRESHHKNNKIKSKNYIALSPKYGGESDICEKLFSFPWSSETCVIHMYVVNGRNGKDLTASSRLY